MEGDVVYVVSKYCPCESIFTNGKGSSMCYGCAVIVCHTRPDRWKDRSR